MADRLEFQGKLGWILEEAKEQAHRIQKEEIERYFENDDLSDEQMELVYDYLLSQKVAVSGYERKHGRVYAAEEKESTLTQEEQTYLQNYERELQTRVGAEQGSFLPFLERVLEIAKELHDGSVFLGDLVQEGNVSLMLALKESGEEEKILNAVREGIEAFQEEQRDVHVRDRKMVEKVDELDGQIKKLKEEMGRKITLEELALYTDRSEEELRSVLKLAGEEVEDANEEG